MKHLRKSILRGRWISVDTETWGNIKEQSVWHPDIRAAYISYWKHNGDGGVFDLASHERETRKWATEFLANPKYVKIFWNAAFDIPVLKKEGFKVRGPVVDAMVLAQTVVPDEVEFSLKHFAKKYLNDLYIEEDQLKAYMRKHKIKEYGDVPYGVISPYALKDARATLELCAMLVPELDRLQLWDTYAAEHALLPHVLSMTEVGVRVSRRRTEELASEAQEKIAKLRSDICVAVGDSKFNPNSGPQIIKALELEKYGERFTKTGRPSTDNLSLLLRGGQLARDIQQYRKYSKAISTYYSTLLSRPVNGRLHCGLNQNRAITGRFSGSGPNLQNQPRSSDTPLGRIRECYVASKGNELRLVDFEQIEMRILAHYAEEPVLLNDIRNNEDLHTNTCVRLFGIGEADDGFPTYRYLAKRLNFAVVYGTGGNKFRDTTLEDSEGLVSLSLEEAKDYIAKWWTEHPSVRNLSNVLATEVARTGGVRTIYGRYIPIRWNKDHAALNYLVQGTAADVMKRAIIRVSRYIKRSNLKMRLLLTVHDELIFDVPPEEFHIMPTIVGLMEVRNRFLVPLTCSLEGGKSWGTKRKLPQTPKA